MSSPIPPHVYETNLATSEYTQFVRPATPTKSPFKESFHRKSPVKTHRQARTEPDYHEFEKLLRDDKTTSGEKDLASRVLKAAEKLREWCIEIEKWGWSGSFELSEEESDQSKDGRTAKAHGCSGSIPQELVESYESRLDDIDTELARLEVDDLKERVLGLHLGRSRPSSSYSTQSVSNLVFMDNFELFVTDTLMSTIPLLAKLEQYLRIWSVRLEVLGNVPALLIGLRALEDDMKKAFRLLEKPLEPRTTLPEKEMLIDALETTGISLKHRTVELGRLLDSMLDVLEGSEDLLPDHWIENFEKNERLYEDWSCVASQRLFLLRVMIDDIDTSKVESHYIEVPDEDRLASTFEPDEQTLEQKVEPFVPIREEEVDVSQVTMVKEVEHSHRGPAIDAIETEDSESTTIHHPHNIGTYSPFTALIEPLDEPNNKEPASDSRDSASAFASDELVIARYNHSSAPTTPTEGNRHPMSWETKASGPQTATNVEIVRPCTPDVGSAKRRDSVSSIASGSSAVSGANIDDSPSLRASMRSIASVPRPPLNYAMRKRRTECLEADPTRAVSTPLSDLEQNANNSPSSSPTKTRKSPKSSQSPSLPLEEQISNILETIPTAIRLKSGSSPSASEIKQRHKNTSQQPRSRASTPLPTLTLAPADEVITRKTGANDPEIKLFHLSEPGLAKPIKLFVRRVGENGERVMVRVGGGWADLGEYLRSYADHHGRRTASDGRVEVLGLNNVPEARAGATTPTSRRPSFVSSIGSSAMAGTIIGDNRSTTPSLPAHMTPRPEGEGTPLSVSAQSAAFGSAGSRRSASTPWDGTDVSLAGPAHRTSKIGDMSEERKQWVEGIVEQAKATVPGRKIEFGDLGKKGATRRVFLKNGVLE